jgi:predicted transcriptional regulator
MLDFNIFRLHIHSSCLPLWLLHCDYASHNIDNRDQAHCCTTLYQARIHSRIVYHISIRMKYRSRTELASNILEAGNGGATKTKIMYKAFLSYGQLKEYLAMLIENNLMTHDIEGIYRTTSKGIRFLETSRQLDGLFVPISTQK